MNVAKASKDQLIFDFIIKNYKGGTFVDVGCKFGLYPQTLKNIIPQERFHCFEPVPSHCKLLRKKYTNVYEMALGDKKTHQTFYFNKTYKSHSGLTTSEGDIEKFDVRVDTLDNQNIKDVSFIKVDVEGHEPYVIQGAYKTINKYKPYIIFEFSEIMSTRYGYDVEFMFDVFDRIGYEIYDFYGKPMSINTVSERYKIISDYNINYLGRPK
jgi:FkbM family methyltransferase